MSKIHIHLMLLSTCSVLIGAVVGDNSLLSDDKDFMLQTFNDVAAYFEGEGRTYNKTYYDKYVQCLQKGGDQDLYRSQMAAWKGMADYYHSNGTSVDAYGKPDHWGECLRHNDVRCPNTEYREYNESKQDYIPINGQDVLIYEPCNYVSNLAFMHSTTKICDYPQWSISNQAQFDQKRAFASLSAGSAFFHGSHTYVGWIFDNQMIGVISYLAYQSSISFIVPESNFILTYLQDTRRKTSSTEVVDSIVKSFYSKEVPQWAKMLNDADFPHNYDITFAAIATTVAFLSLPSLFAYGLIYVLAKGILHPDDATFMTTKYLPEMRKVMAQVKVPEGERSSLFFKFLGALMKIIYAFLYQEKYFNVPGFQNKHMVKVGGHAISVMNDFADALTQFPQTDQAVNDSVGVYPGENTCKFQQGHSIWHEVSANGLLDLVYLCDFIHHLTKEFYVPADQFTA